MAKVNAILLAAGLSNRMNGPNKLLMPLKESSVIASVYNALCSSQVAQIIVVTGRDASKVELAIKLRGNDQFVHNEEFSKGMTSSIKRGLKAAPQNEALMICLGDMPCLQPNDYDQVIGAFQKNGQNKSILVPWYQEKRANPVTFSHHFFNEINGHKESNGCAGIVRSNRDFVVNLNVESERFIRDIDTVEDFERITEC